MNTNEYLLSRQLYDIRDEITDLLGRLPYINLHTGVEGVIQRLEHLKRDTEYVLENYQKSVKEQKEVK